jgi:hypothetical protein
LGDAFTLEQIDAWHEVFEYVATMLIAGAGTVQGEVASHSTAFIVRTWPCRRAIPELGGNRRGYRRLPEILRGLNQYFSEPQFNKTFG